MDKEEKYSNRMRLPKDGAILAENDNIVLKAVSEDQKYHMLSVSYECSFLKHELVLCQDLVQVKMRFSSS